MKKSPSPNRGSKECFVVCPIGPEKSDIRKRSNQIAEYIIRPVVESRGYTTIRGDQLEYSGQITTQVIEKVFEADLVVADLTDQNPNVFYELALRHASKKPFIHLIADDQTIPFDLQGWRAIALDHRDLDSVHQAKLQLESHLDHIDQGKPVESPVTHTFDWQQLRESENAEERGLAEVMREVGSLQEMIIRLAADMQTLRPDSPFFPGTAGRSADHVRHSRASILREAREQARFSKEGRIDRSGTPEREDDTGD